LEKTFQEQSPKVQQAYENIYRKIAESEGETPEITELLFERQKNRTKYSTGHKMYNYIVSRVGSPKAASKAFKEEGIVGSKFLDGISRRKGEGTHNLVIWDPDVITVVRTFGLASLVAGGLLSQEIADQMKADGIDKEQQS
jgi:hypothetical protein